MSVRFAATSILTSLGRTTPEVFDQIRAGRTGVSLHNDPVIYPSEFPASRIDDSHWQAYEHRHNGPNGSDGYTRLERMLLHTAVDALRQTTIDPASPRTVVILSTTKGNIDLLEQVPDPSSDDLSLWKAGQVIGTALGNPHPVVVISNACISGVLALNTAADLLQSRQYDHALVLGGDLVSRFVVSGFMSFLSLSPTSCKPFDRDRDGLSLGEAAGAIIMDYTDHPAAGDMLFAGGATANDANHISGPSRTAEGSVRAIRRALDQAGMQATDIDHINAHGTATRYNDDMESIALHRLQLDALPVNSHKGSLGHTLGAAGIIETALVLESMHQQIMLPTVGYHTSGTTHPLNVVTTAQPAPLRTCLKLASGFGGSNAALIITKNQQP